MKRVIYESFGNPVEVLKTVEAPSTPLLEGHVRLKMLRAPINPSDVIQVAGQYGVKPPLPATGGNEGLGEVIEGDAFPLGQHVIVAGAMGTWATEMVVPAQAVIPVPSGDLDQMSMLLVNPATAYLLLEEYGDLKEGDWIIQSAANSAVGAYVIQLCKARGINLVNVVRRESAIAGLKELGAEHVLVGGPEMAEAAKALSGDQIKLALDSVAGGTTGELASALTEGGTLVPFGAISRQPISVSAGNFVFNNIQMRGFWLLKWMQQASEEKRRATYGKITELVMNGTLHAPIERHFSLDEINDAAALALKGERTGKIILAPNGL
jgi:NADPH:quinone reductase-like Zn-dependent oxidoreductase